MHDHTVCFVDPDQARRCRDCPGLGHIACGISPLCPTAPLPCHTAEEVRHRKQGERWARWLRRYAPWLRPIILTWIVEPVAELVNAIVDDRLGDHKGGK